MKLLSYYFFRLLILVFRYVSFKLMYRLAWVIYLLIYYVVRYRLKVVRNNLRHSFPGKTTVELREIEKKYYRFLSDLTLESFKAFSMTPADIQERYRLRNPELVNDYFSKGQSLIAVMAHYGNWEWGTLVASTQLTHPLMAFYKPIQNKRMDDYVKKSRAQWKTNLLSIKGTFFSFARHKDDVTGWVMIADQNPSNMSECIWVDFLNQRTPCLHGPEKYAKLYNYPVIYIEVNPVRRGYYTIELSLLEDNPSRLQEGELTAMYYASLEKTILRQPEYWLWSHKRWKNVRDYDSE